MLETMVITLREGLEAFLIVAIMLAYLNKTGRKSLNKAVYSGVVLAVLASIASGYALYTYSANDEAAEGVMAMVAGVLVATMVYYMMKTARHFKKEITDKMEETIAHHSLSAFVGIMFFTCIMITREGMEISLLMTSLLNKEGVQSVLAGSVFGVVAAVAVSYAWVRYSHLINIGRFLQVTSLFLLLFCVHLFLYGLHELDESGVVEITGFWHELAEIYSSKGLLKPLLSYSMIIIPMAWLAFVVVKHRIALVRVKP